MENKIFRFIPLILALLIFVTAVGYRLTKENPRSAEDTLIPHSKGSVTPSSKVDGWKTYKNKTYGFETKYDPASPPHEDIGTEEVGQFTYLLQVRFGVVPLKSVYGYTFEVSKKSIDSYRLELVGHITDRIDSEVESVINGNRWTKLNYQLFLTTDNVPVTTAILPAGKYSFAITASSSDIDKILNTFKFDKGSIIPWSEAVNKIKNCEIKSVSQSHDLKVTLVDKDDMVYSSTESKIDEVFNLTNQISDKCPIMSATE